MTTKTKTTTTDNRPQVWQLTQAEEMTLCEVIRFIDLRAMHQSNGTDTALNDLIRGCYLDTIITGSKDKDGNTKTNTTEQKYLEADKLRTLAKAERAQADIARKTLNRVRITDEERTEAFYSLMEHSTIADNYREEAEDIEKVNQAQTFSLAQDMLHHIWLELQAIKADPDRQTETAFSDLCKAGRQFVQSMTAVTAIDSNNTISRPLSKAEAVELMTRYNVDPKARPRQKWTQTAKGCTGYYTLEAKERKRDTDPAKVDPAIIAQYMHYNDACIWYYENITQPSTNRTTPESLTEWHKLTQAQKATALQLDPADNPVLYLVCHIPTIRKQTPIDTMTDHDNRTAEAISTSTTADIDPVKLAEYAKLSEQARTAIRALTDPQAITQAKTAYNATIAQGQASIDKLQADREKAGKKPYAPGKVKQMQDQYKQTADNAYSTALWEYALTQAGYTAKAKAKSTIIAKLTEARKTAPDSIAPGMIDYSRLMKDTHRGHADTTPAKLKDPYILLASTTTTDPDGKHHTQWNTAHPVQIAKAIQWTESGQTPQAINPGKDYRAEAILKSEVITQANNEAHRASRNAYQARLDQLRAEGEKIRAEWQARPTHTITPAEWNKLPGQDRLALLDRIHADGKRLDFIRA